MLNIALISIFVKLFIRVNLDQMYRKFEVKQLALRDQSTTSSYVFFT